MWLGGDGNVTNPHFAKWLLLGRRCFGRAAFYDGVLLLAEWRRSGSGSRMAAWAVSGGGGGVGRDAVLGDERCWTSGSTKSVAAIGCHVGCHVGGVANVVVLVAAAAAVVAIIAIVVRNVAIVEAE